MSVPRRFFCSFLFFLLGVDSVHDGHGVNPSCGAPDGGDGCDKNDQHDGAQSTDREIPGDAPLGGDHGFIQVLMQGQTCRAAGYASADGVGGGFRGDHEHHLSAAHADGPQGAVLADARGDAHGDAVDDVKHGDQCNHGEKTVDEEGHGPVGAFGLRVACPLVGEGDPRSRQIAEGFHIAVGGIVP